MPSFDPCFVLLYVQKDWSTLKFLNCAQPCKASVLFLCVSYSDTRFKEASKSQKEETDFLCNLSSLMIDSFGLGSFCQVFLCPAVTHKVYFINVIPPINDAISSLVNVHCNRHMLHIWGGVV